jgi:membrane protein required for colicin V production
LGGVFGAFRGLILILFIMLVAGLTPVPQDPWWQQSRSIQSLLPLAEWSAKFLPDYILEYMDLTPDLVETKSVDT